MRTTPRGLEPGITCIHIRNARAGGRHANGTYLQTITHPALGEMVEYACFFNQGHHFAPLADVQKMARRARPDTARFGVKPSGRKKAAR